MNGLKNEIDENSITIDPKKKKEKKKIIKQIFNISAIFVFHQDLRIKYGSEYLCLMKIQLEGIILKKFEF